MSLLGVFFSFNLFNESVSFLGTESFFANGLIETCIDRGTGAAFFLMMDRQAKIL